MFADYLTEPADILSARPVDGDVRINVGDVASDGEGWSADVAMWGVPGFISIPDPPDADGAAQALLLVDGQEKRSIAARDNRIASKIGEGKAGDRFIVCRRDARVLVKAEENAVNIYTVNEEDDDASMMLDLRGKTGVAILLNGGCMIRQKTDEMVISIADGPTFLMDKDGFQFTGKSFHVDCSTITLGLIQPAGVRPQLGTNNALTGLTGLAAVPSSTVMIASP
jgi:hypothetical protein